MSRAHRNSGTSEVLLSGGRASSCDLPRGSGEEGARLNSLTEIIAERSVEDGDCLRWTGGCAGKRDHPAIYINTPKRKCVLIRRAVWEAKHGLIPAGRIVRCTCGTPRCIALEHLELTTFKKLGLELGALGIMSGPVRSAKIAESHRARHPNTKLTQDEVRDIRASDEPGTVLAARYGVTESSISKYRLQRCRREFGGNIWRGLAA